MLKIHLSGRKAIKERLSRNLKINYTHKLIFLLSHLFTSSVYPNTTNLLWNLILLPFWEGREESFITTCMSFKYINKMITGSSLYIWWCVSVHTMASQDRNLETEALIVSNILRTAQESRVSPTLFTDWNPGRNFQGSRDSSKLR